MGLLIGSRNETNKDGTVLLHVRFKNKLLDKKIYTSIKVYKKYWDKKNKRLKPDHPYFEQKNKQVKKLTDVVHDLHMQSAIGTLTFEEAKTRLTYGSYVNDINSYLDNHLKDQMRDTTFNDYKNKVRSVASNIGIKNLTFQDVCQKQVWVKLKKVLLERGRSPATFNTYHRAIKAIHSHALKDEITFNVFPHVRTNPQNNFTPQWIKSHELIDVIKDLNPNDKKFNKEVISILIYLLMFSMRGMYAKDLEKLSMKSFVNSTYENHNTYLFAEKNMVYKHFRSKTNKMGLVYMGLDPIKKIIRLLNNITNTNSDSLFPIMSGSVDDSVWKVNQMQFKKLTGHSYKSARKAFNTTGSIISIPDADIRELMFQTDNTISKHYKDTQAPMMLAKYTKFHSDILIKYRVSEMFEMLRDKVITL